MSDQSVGVLGPCININGGRCTC